MPVTRVASHAYVNPVVGVALGYFVAGEAITTRMILASLLVIASVFLILSAPAGLDSRSRRAPSHRHGTALICPRAQGVTAKVNGVRYPPYSSARAQVAWDRAPRRMARLLCEAADLARDRRRKCPLRVSHSIARADGILAFGKVRGCAHRSRAEARLAGGPGRGD